MKFYLSSYHLGEKAVELAEWARAHGRKVILIPNAKDVYDDGEHKAQSVQKDVAELQQLGCEVEVVSLTDYFGKPEELARDFGDYHTFYVIGGNCFALRLAMRLSGFDKFVIDNLSRDDICYAGYSAGICVLPPRMQGLDIVDEPVNPYNGDEVLYEGLGVVDSLLVPHYKSDHPEAALVDKVVEYCESNNVRYMTLRDGEVELIEVTEL